MSAKQAQPLADTATKSVIPEQYEIEITPDNANLKFTGRVSIRMRVTAPTRQITINALNLTFTSASAIDGSGASIPASVAVHLPRESANLRFDRPLTPGTYSLEMHYGGMIQSTSHEGLFIDREKDGAKRGFLYTHMEPNNARRLFPGWDSPDKKAVFDLTVIIPKGEMGVSNMAPVETQDTADGKTRIRFASTPRMSTYLLFLGAGDLKRVTRSSGGLEYGLVARSKDITKGDYAMEAATIITPWFEQYFGIPYGLPKMDLVLTLNTGKTYNAMENWGAILSSEEDMYPSKQSPKELITLIMAHEIAHQWIGNMVSPASWEHLWLSEGTATWLEKRSTAALEVKLKTSEWRSFLEMDQLAGAKAIDISPLSTTVLNRSFSERREKAEASTILYIKGGAVISMLEAYAGEERWQKVMRRYVNKHQGGNVTTDDLIAAMEAEGLVQARSMVMDFVAQTGLPVISVSRAQCTDNQLTLTLAQSAQTRFDERSNSMSARKWTVPVYAKSLNGQEARTLVTGGAGSLTVKGCDPVIVNAGYSGYYRVSYAPDIQAGLNRQLERVSAIDQVGMIQDAISLGDEGQLPIDTALDLLAAIPANAKPQVIGKAADYFSRFWDEVGPDLAARADLARRLNPQFGKMLDAVGFDEKPEETEAITQLRTSLMAVLGRTGYKPLVEHAQKRFPVREGQLSGLETEVDFLLASISYGNASKEDWEIAETRAKKALARPFFFSPEPMFLVTARDPALVSRALPFALDPKMPPMVRTGMIWLGGQEHPDLVINFMATNAKTFFGGSEKDIAAAIDAMLATAGNSYNAATATLIAAIGKKIAKNEAMATRFSSAANGIRRRAKMAEKQKPTILRWAKAVP